MHARAVVPEEGLGHEGGHHVVAAGHVLDHILVLHELVGHGHQGVEHHVDFGLSAGGDLVMVSLDLDADLLHEGGHLGADVHLAVGRRNGEVTFLIANLVGQVGILVTAGVPQAFRGIHGIEAAVHGLVELHVVENKEFGFRAPVGDVGDAGGLQVIFGFLRHIPGVAGVGFTGDGIDRVTGQDQSGCLKEGIDESGIRIRNQEHIGLVNGLEPADGGTIKTLPILENVLVKKFHGRGGVLPNTGKVHETEIDVFHVLLFDQIHDFLGSHIVSSYRN